ncbi:MULTISPECIES: TolC family protein [Pedobacter]|uniref:Outer membrane efflux protein n=1 Tax=Pedobacter heparinus (strain ATCC 13125 / DSM 2366 / CIP 104194 / JCM 7457 / NBRC 12017 / NCIMB 9290 / NRRL B-14731 / HIM 762-3) TaxID=485917 RepID=C6XUA4_PEDHD|nr:MULTISPECIES: TolC family protein [Pedobacter]ACU05897.1 outer membrane efflux protein [Pedobacter heparinus DSM 2366]MBB5438677.1 outer membrane protein TolC [Pedobacter sp. AK017]
MNTIIKQIKVIPVLLLGLLLSNTVNAQQTMTLKEALNYAVQNSVKTRKSKLDIDGGKYKTEEIRAQALPQITGNAGLTYNPIIGQLVANIGGQTQSFKLGQNWNSSAGVQLSQQLFNQTVFTGLQAAKSSEEYYNLVSQLTEEQIIELVANNYYQVLVNRQQLNVVDNNIKNVKVIEKIISNQYQNGLAKKIDVDRIKVNLTNLETQREQTLNLITQLENQLKFSMGMPVSTDITLPKTELTEVTRLPQFADSLSLANRTEIKILDTQDKLYWLQRKAYVSEYYPSLALTGNYTYSSQSGSFDFLSSNNTAIGFGSSAVGLTLKVPIFNGFLTRSKIRQADIDIKKAREDRRESTNSLNLAYENAKIQLRNSLNTINAQKKNAELADEIYRSTQNNYNNGLANLTDLLDTENALTEAQNSYTQALLNYKIAEIQLIKSNGNIKSLLQ